MTRKTPPGPAVVVGARVGVVDYPTLARLAERRGYDTIADMLSAMLVKLASVTDAHDEVEIMVRAGFCDADIAEHLNLMVGTIADRRRRLGLPANPRYRAQPKEHRHAQPHR